MGRSWRETRKKGSCLDAEIPMREWSMKAEGDAISRRYCGTVCASPRKVNKGEKKYSRYKAPLNSTCDVCWHLLDCLWTSWQPLQNSAAQICPPALIYWAVSVCFVSNSLNITQQSTTQIPDPILSLHPWTQQVSISSQVKTQRKVYIKSFSFYQRNLHGNNNH